MFSLYRMVYAVNPTTRQQEFHLQGYKSFPWPMFYHHVLAWKACYTCFTAVLCKPTSRTGRIVSINSPSGEGGEIPLRKLPFLFAIAIMFVSINSPSGEGGESYVFKPRHSKAFRPPNRRTPLAKKSTWGFLPK